MSPRLRVPLLVVATVVVVALLTWSRGGPEGSGSNAPAAPGASADSGTIAYAALPREGRQVLRAIEAGGPFAYDRDGVTFGNREGLLPRQRSGFYREYTVPTPGSPDRGARRIVAGEDGTLYYTDDHYASFRVIVAVPGEEDR